MDGREWLRVLESAFEANDGLAEDTARLWRELLGLIGSGPEGIRQARETLETAIRLSFHYTQSYRTCRDQFEASLLEPPDFE